MNRLIRRAIHHWLAWKSRRKLAREYNWQTEIDAEIRQAKQSHGKTGRVRDLERRKRDMMTHALRGHN
ncbi:hypothetical protein AGRHK599_LOCUS1256 [Rhizobium rhizogenes]|uniref:Uncharacterized protein n=1 Tax=Rhizobium rhizogenes TaxID=359 RepID=A0AAN2A3I1_RHIRH|nr:MULTISPECIES: hypothetical protein [Rhizobium/Agrobacterium group]AQS61741.1 hypothetical protein B0909_05385 [Rhizobium rhizogenes]MCZ7443031.1 hypothetical protein [Rhizobium rhizogenes]NSZ79016.1 hypothetical protein [Agrobacterium tumefaciens]OAM65813.1 hypothetical protein A8L48_22740 [Rhizobium rhizogenes]CAD0211230.1 hypothetical protein AGRHK599_LOCUS1256 [Rhizobium rhizogenes]